jgi:hypothetical protein
MKPLSYLFLTLIMFTGCKSAQLPVGVLPTASQLASPAITPSTSSLALPTITSTLKQCTLAPEATSTRLPAGIPTRSVISYPTATSINLAGLEEGREILAKWFDGASECRLPCWNNIIPGITTWDDTRHFMQPIIGLSVYEEQLNAYYEFELYNTISWWYFVSPFDVSG